MPLPQRSLAVVGADFPNKRGPTRRFEIAICKPGERVQLVPEPKNPVDPQAIAVYSCRDVQLGYIRSEQCQWVNALLRDDRVTGAIFQDASAWGAIIRLGFDGEAPALPVADARESEQDGWDQTPPDEWAE